MPSCFAYAPGQAAEKGSVLRDAGNDQSGRQLHRAGVRDPLAHDHLQQAALAAAVPPAQTHAFSLPDLCAEGRADHASLIAWRDIVQPHQHIAVMAERADLQLIHPLYMAKQGTLFGNGLFTARLDGFRALHHLSGFMADIPFVRRAALARLHLIGPA